MNGIKELETRAEPREQGAKRIKKRTVRKGHRETEGREGSQRKQNKFMHQKGRDLMNRHHRRRKRNQSWACGYLAAETKFFHKI